MLRYSLVWLMSLAILDGQTQVDLKNQSKSVDFSSASSTKPIQAGTVLPAVCNTAQLFFLTTAPTGANLYACAPANTWTLETGGGSGSTTNGSGAPTGACVVGAIYNDTTDGNTWFCQSTNVWVMALTTNDVGSFLLTGENGSTNPATPSSGSTVLFFSATAKTGQTIDDTGALGTMVRPTDCSGSAQLVQKISSSGTITCAAPAVAAITYNFSGGSGSSSSPQTGAWWQDGSTTAVCPAGTPFQCYLHWNSGNILAVTTSVPHAWAGGVISVALRYQGNGSGNTVQPAVSSSCVNNGSAGYTFNTAQSFGSQTTSGSNYYLATLPSLTATGCSADSLMVLEFSRLDSGGFLNLPEASITFNIP
jgi:hypothetical protein